jgi:serine/threonine-protein kinase RIO1
MLVTLFTDASHCGRTHVAAYAVWAKADGYTIRHARVLKQRVPDSSVAEAQAIVNGLCFAIAVLRPLPGSKIIAQTDCMAAISALTGKLAKRKSIERYASITSIYAARIVSSGVAVEFRHVSAHRGVATPRNAVNTWCDKECRRLMRLARDTVPPV